MRIIDGSVQIDWILASRNLTKRELAQVIGRSPSYVTLLLRQQKLAQRSITKTTIKYEVLHGIAERLGIDPKAFANSFGQLSEEQESALLPLVINGRLNTLIERGNAQD